MTKLTAILPVMLLACSLSAQAAITITIAEVGDNVVITGGGSIITTNGLEPIDTEPTENQQYIDPSNIRLHRVGDLPPGFMGPSTYSGVTGPQSLGTGGYIDAASSSGSNFTLSRNYIGVPNNYQIGAPIDFLMTFTNQTISSLGITPGSYKWTWGTQDDGDFVILCAGVPAPCEAAEPPAPATPTPVPTLGAFSLMGLAGVIGAAGVAMNRRRKQ